MARLRRIRFILAALGALVARMIHMSMLAAVLLCVLAPPIPDVPKGAKWKEELTVKWVPKEAWVGEEAYVYEDALEATEQNVIRRTRKMTANLIAGEKQPLPATEAKWEWLETWKSPVAKRDNPATEPDQKALDEWLLPRWPTKEWTQQNDDTWTAPGWFVIYDDLTLAPRRIRANLTGVLKPGADRTWRLEIEMRRLEGAGN